MEWSNIDIRIKANVNDLTISQIFELLVKYRSEREDGMLLYEFNGFVFTIETEVSASINYVITQVFNQTE